MKREEIEHVVAEALRLAHERNCDSRAGTTDEDPYRAELVALLTSLVSRAYDEAASKADFLQSQPNGFAEMAEGRSYVSGYDVACSHLRDQIRFLKEDLQPLVGA